MLIENVTYLNCKSVVELINIKIKKERILKMKKVARIIAGICGAALIFSAAGCGRKTAGTNTAGVTVIEVWSSDTSSKAVYTKLIDKYNSGEGKKAGIKIDYKVKDGESYQQALDLAYKSGNAPDMFLAPNIATMVEKNQLMPIDDIPGTEDLMKVREGYIRDFYNSYNGKTYSLPTSGGTMGLLYNKEMFKKAGIVDKAGNPNPPETWDELRECAKKLTNFSKQQYGIILPFKWSGWYDSDVNAAGMASLGIRSGYDPTTGKFDFSGYEPILNTFLGIRDDKSYFPGAETIDNDVARARFAEGNIGMKIGFSFDVGVLNDQFPAKIDWGVAPLPVVDKNHKYMQPNDPGSSFSVNAETKIDKDKLAKALNFFYGEDLIVELYKNCVAAPYNPEIVKDVKIKNPKKGWMEFCDLLNIAVVVPVNVKNDVSNETLIGDNFINKVWVGKMSVKEALDHETKIRNDGIEKYKSMHPEYDGSKYIIPDWNPVRE